MKVEIIAAIVSWIGILYLSSPEFLKWLYWDFSGIRFIWEKIKSPKQEITENPQYKKPATFLLWLIGIYVALFGVASQRFENTVDRIENRTNAILALAVKDETRANALSFIPQVQGMRVPKNPEFFNPIITLKSMFLGKTEEHEDSIEILRGIIVGFKKQLLGADLAGANLKGEDLKGANLRGADLRVANLRRADLTEANLREAKLVEANLGEAGLARANLIEAKLVEANLVAADLGEANLGEANLWKANLMSANLGRADLREANLREANLRGASLGSADLREANLVDAKNLKIELLFTVKTLYKAQLNSELMKQIKKKYPHLLKKPGD
jgi:uncharacterized protein YjbI with pentapeptide repeats